MPYNGEISAGLRLMSWPIARKTGALPQSGPCVPDRMRNCLPLRRKPSARLKDNTECDLVNRNGDVWSVTFWGMAFYQKHCEFMAG